MDTIYELNKKHLVTDLPELKPGYTVQVHQKVQEGDKERIQIFEGIILALKNGKGIDGTMTVRRIASGVGVEKIFPLHSPSIAAFKVVKKATVRRAKLYYLRDLDRKKRLVEEKVALKEAKKAPAQPASVVEASVAPAEVTPATATEKSA